MAVLMLLAVLSGGGHKTPTNTVDLIEVNHKQSEDECMQFTQVILWQWSPDYRRFDVVHWYIPSSACDYPQKVGEFYHCAGTDIGGKRHSFRAKLFRESTSTTDPERENTRLFPVELRSRLH